MVSASTSSALHPDVLRLFQLKAQQLKQLIGTTTLPPSLTYGGPIPDLNLPFPYDDLILIDNMSFPKHIREQLKSIFSEKISETQRTFIESYQRTCRELSRSLISFEHVTSLADAFQNFYNDQLPKFRMNLLVITSRSELVKKNHMQETKKPIFKSEYTPLLEKYFEHNAYPSRPDRLLLARKSSMSERQIEVWFQNHRNRSKKDGIPLKRITSQPSSVDFLQRKTDSGAVPLKETPSSSQADTDMPDIHNGIPHAAVDHSNESFLNAIATPRTFPVPYRRSSQNSLGNSFPLQESISRFTPPNWPRKPATQPPSYLPINMEEFIGMFASKLNIRRGSGTKSTRKTSKPWFHAMVTIPSPAPHPALIRTETAFQPSIPTSLFWNAASSPRTMFNASSSNFSSASDTFKRAPKPRKMAPFAYRAPQRLFSLPTSDTSISTAQPSDSRTSSFASVSSFQSRSSSVLSTGSSPGPTTPPHSPTNDKHIVHEPALQDPSSDKYIDDLFAGVPPDVPQSFDDFLSNINSEDLFSDKYLPTSIHNFPYPDSLYAAA